MTHLLRGVVPEPTIFSCRISSGSVDWEAVEPHAMEFLRGLDHRRGRMVLWGEAPLLEWEFVRSAVEFVKAKVADMDRSVVCEIVTDGRDLRPEHLAFIRSHPKVHTAMIVRPRVQYAWVPAMVWEHWGELTSMPGCAILLAVEPDSLAHMVEACRWALQNGITRIGFRPEYGADWKERDFLRFEKAVGELKDLVVASPGCQAVPEWLPVEPADAVRAVDGSGRRHAHWLCQVDGFPGREDPDGVKAFPEGLERIRRLSGLLEIFRIEAASGRQGMGRRKRWVAAPGPEPEVRRWLRAVQDAADDGERVLRVGSVCNNNCSFCAPIVEAPADRPLNEIETEIEGWSPRPSRVRVLGGEPTLHVEFFRLLDLLDRRSVSVDVETNARMCVYPEFAKAWARFKTAGATVGLHGPSAVVHDYLTQSPGSFSQTRAGLARMVKEGMDVKVRAVVTQSNVRHLSETLALARNLGARSCVVVFPGAHEVRGPFMSVVPPVSIALEHVERAAEWADGFRMPVQVEGMAPCQLALGVLRYARPGPLNCCAEPKQIHAEPCRECAGRPVCPGIGATYLERRGEAELRPVQVVHVTTHRQKTLHADTPPHYA